MEEIEDILRPATLATETDEKIIEIEENKTDFPSNQFLGPQPMMPIQRSYYMHAGD